MISSSDNKQVKNVIQLISSSKARKKQGLFVVEGIRMIQETPLDRIEAVYIAASYEDDYLQHPMSQNCAYEVVEVGYTDSTGNPCSCPQKKLFH